MIEQIIPLMIAIVLIAIAWKVLKGIIKTVALVAILAGVGYFVFVYGGLAT